MPRCSACNMFCATELQEPTEDGIEWLARDGEIGIGGSIELSLMSECCGMEVATASLDVEDMSIELEHAKDCKDDDAVDVGFEVSETDRYETKDRHGKPITNPRYRRHYYGVEITATATCSSCHAEATVTETLEEQASAFEEIY